jgi:hypothetical protein
VAASHLNEQVRDNQTVLKTALTDAGKIVAISSTYFESLDGSELTGVAKLGASNDFSAGTHNYGSGAGARLVVPVGSSKWAT